MPYQERLIELKEKLIDKVRGPEHIRRLKDKSFVVGKEVIKTGEIPSISVYGETLPEAWETAVLATLSHGTEIPTEYDQEVDPESKDASVLIVITDPLKEPRIHKALPCGLDELAIYVHEVVDGVRDYKVGEGGWSYSYHDRFENWPGKESWEKIEQFGEISFKLPNINQLEALVNKLAKVPHSRRAQAITWFPPIDSSHHEPPCLQRAWCRVIKSDEDLYLLEMNTHWRSRDAFKAAFMNMFALTELQKKIAEDISSASRRKVEAGRYLDISDSFHIYGQYIRRGEMENFYNSIRNRKFEERVYRSDEPIVQSEFARGRERLARGR